MAGFNRIQSPQKGTGEIYVRFRKTSNEEFMRAYAERQGLEFVRLAPDNYDAGIFSTPENIADTCKILMRDYDFVFVARELTKQITL
jgi:hypothetical protein